jgi:hypothetical protein
VDALNALSAQKSAEVFAFLPAKAGSGATTTALFVADLLSRRAHRRTLVLECDFDAGPISMLSKLQPRYSILDALEDSLSLNEANWKELVSRVDGIDVLVSAGRVGLRKANAFGYQSLLSFVRGRYDIVIADLPEVVNDATEVVVRAAKTVFVVTAPSTPSLYLATRRRYDLELPRESGWAIGAEKVASIPWDENLMDASDFRPALARSATLAGFARIAECCSGVALGAPTEMPRKSWFEGWTRSSRALAHSTSAAR